MIYFALKGPSWIGDSRIMSGGAYASMQLVSWRSRSCRAIPQGTDCAILVRFVNVREGANIRFRQDATQTEEKYYLETVGTEAAWIDDDQDGLMNLYFVQSAATDFYKPPHPIRSSLYHNNGDRTFSDVTEKAGVGGEGHHGQGVAVGDFDNDGYPDLYVTGYGRAILYPNNAKGTVTDVTAKAGVADESGWSTSAGWFDSDKDGWLDLVVTNYVPWSPKDNTCAVHSGRDTAPTVILETTKGSTSSFITTIMTER